MWMPATILRALRDDVFGEINAQNHGSVRNVWVAAKRRIDRQNSGTPLVVLAIAL